MNIPIIPCAIYTRKSSEEGLVQNFNSLDAQRESCEAYIVSQKAQGWRLVAGSYDDGGFSGGNIERPGLKALLEDIDRGKIRIVVVYKVDRLTRSLADFAKLVERFDARGASFVSVTQQFNTTTSMGRLTLNVLLSFAQFEREVTGERIRDKIAASKKKGLWMGGIPPMGYKPHERTLVIEEPEAERIRHIYRRYLHLGCVRKLKHELDSQGWRTPPRNSQRPGQAGCRPFARGHLHLILRSQIYRGYISHKGEIYPGQHPAIIDEDLWQQVQVALAANLQGFRHGKAIQRQSLLSGLLVDTDGQKFTTVGSAKSGRRYRYYVNPTLHTAGREENPEGLRLPATQIEDAVVEATSAFLSNTNQLSEAVAIQEVWRLKAALAFAENLAGQLQRRPANGEEFASRLELVQKVIIRILVDRTTLALDIRLDVATSQAAASIRHSIHRLEVPLNIQHRAGAVRLSIYPERMAPRPEPDAHLIDLLTMANVWFRKLTRGPVESIKQLASEENVSVPYATRIVYLALLSPRIVQTILAGSDTLVPSKRRLLAMLPLSPSWKEQERQVLRAT